MELAEGCQGRIIHSELESDWKNTCTMLVNENLISVTEARQLSL